MFTILMVLVIVYVMICYNIALNIGGMQNHVFADALHELVLMAPAAFVLDFFFVGMIAKNTAFCIVDPAKSDEFTNGIFLADFFRRSAGRVCIPPGIQQSSFT